MADEVVPGLTADDGYDEVDRLTSVARSGDVQSFQWDKGDNRMANRRESRGDFGVGMDRGSNRMVSWSGAGKTRNFGYDHAGNQISDAGTDGSYTDAYDDFNRMNGVYLNGGRVGDYRNNALNQRSYMTADAELLAEIGGPRDSNYVWLDGELLGVARGKRGV